MIKCIITMTCLLSFICFGCATIKYTQQYDVTSAINNITVNIKPEGLIWNIEIIYFAAVFFELLTEIITIVSKYADPKIIFIVVDALSKNGEDFCKSVIDIEIFVDVQDLFLSKRWSRIHVS